MQLNISVLNFFCEMKFSASIATNKQKYLEIFKEKNAHACL